MDYSTLNHLVSQTLTKITAYGVFIITPVLLLLLINLKSIPLAWHMRLFYGYIRHYYLERDRPIPLSTPTNLTLFQPTIYTSSTPLMELDFNLHKSNATYFSDLDIARGHHLYCLFRLGFSRYNSDNAPTVSSPTSSQNSSASKTKSGRVHPALGGVTCTFKREIKPYQQYDIWTRVVSWDSKWLYLISHFVEKGAGTPIGYSDQPWRQQQLVKEKIPSVEKGGTDGKGKSGGKPVKQPKVYAFAVSKYAFKQGRLTVSPVTFLEACELLPKISSGEGGSADDLQLWETIEAKRKAGMGLCGNMAALEEGMGLFEEEEICFARY
ncbi:hypothetical protein BKA65DRAFT_506108 [Rhexocercosporidium sp. MPI-PUGE-AT-0058]|nr:hypothetical protein BKA65DRAFT_506108 [Rhexocercosporidium sp. MPI-PUGE-AT-0058]